MGVVLCRSRHWDSNFYIRASHEAVQVGRYASINLTQRIKARICLAWRVLSPVELDDDEILAVASHLIDIPARAVADDSGEAPGFARVHVCTRRVCAQLSTARVCPQVNQLATPGHGSERPRARERAPLHPQRGYRTGRCGQ